MNTNFAVILSTMTALADATHPDFSALGVTKKDFDKATGTTPWTVNDRNAVLNTFKAIVYSTTDALGLDRSVLGPEFVAAAIATIVAPQNWMPAAHWICTDIKTGRPIITAEGEEVGFTKTHPSLLQQLVWEAGSSDGAGASRKAMLAKMGKTEG